MLSTLPSVVRDVSGMVLPNFYILGAQKCGTTWLASMLRQHSEVFIPRQKEIHYFNRAENYGRGREWYAKQFLGCGSALAVGDATPDYLAVTWTAEGAQVAKRIFDLTPDARFIVSLRNPAVRAVSALLHHIRAGRLPPETDLDAQLDLMLSGCQPTHGVLEIGQYGRQIRIFRHHFPADRFAILIYEEDIALEKRATLRALCRFLNVRPDYSFRRVHAVHNPTLRTQRGLRLLRHLPGGRGNRLVWWAERLGLGKRLAVSTETLQRLHAYYEVDKAELRALIGRDLATWQTDSPDGFEVTDR